LADRSTSVEELELITDPVEKAAREGENGLLQAQLAIEIIKTFVKDKERPFRLRQSLIIQLHAVVLKGIHRLAGTFRNGPAKIQGSGHQPPDYAVVSDEVADMCEYVNTNWGRSAVHLAAYVLWRMNWIHPFADGNGRTARAVSYIVMSVKLDSLLPGSTTIPDQIASDKTPYYDALEKADLAWKKSETVDVSALEQLLSGMLATQLVQAAREAEEEAS
jgi:Fic family protein